MKITVRLFATLREGRGREVLMDAESGVTPLSILRSFEIDERDVAILLVNGRDGRLDSPLAEGDRVSLFPPVGGG